MVFVGLSALVSQLAPTSRAANGMSAAPVGVAFLLRAVEDAQACPFLSTEGERFWSSLAAGAVQLPAALIFVAVTTLVFAALPRVTVGIGWLLLAVALVIGQFGGVLGLPDCVRDISPFDHTPAIPGPDPNWTGALIVLAVAIAILALSLLVVRRRESIN